MEREILNLENTKAALIDHRNFKNYCTKTYNTIEEATNMIKEHENQWELQKNVNKNFEKKDRDLQD